MGNYDHILQCQDGDKDAAFLVPMAGWTPKENLGSGKIEDGLYGFDILDAEIVSKGESAKTRGKNLHMTLRSAEPAAFANVVINVWHGFPTGAPKNEDGTENVNYARDLARFQSIIASIKSATPGALEQATAEGATPVKITPRALIGRRVFAQTRSRDWTDNSGRTRQSSEIWFYVVKNEFDVRPGPGAKIESGPIAQTERPEVVAGAMAAQRGNGTQGGKDAAKDALDRALGL